MRKATLFAIGSSCLLIAALPSVAGADTDRNFQLCTATGSGTGPNAIECVDRAGAVTQIVSTGGNGGVTSGGNAGGLSQRGDRVLAVNAASGDATLFRVNEGRLERPELLSSGGSPVSGALGRGAYVLTGTELLHFSDGDVTPDSGRPLLLGDGSAAQVVVSDDFAYVSEKNGSLEAFRLADDGRLVGGATAVAGVTPGVIVGIAVQGDVVVAPIAHLASNPGQSEIDIVRGLGVIAYDATSQVAACWADGDHGSACITNPGSHTISCGQVTAAGLRDFTQVAAADADESQFDIAVRDSLVGVLVKSPAGVFSLHGYELGGGNQLSSIGEAPIGAAANGAVLLPAIHR
jgi:hypothetical protein